MSKKRKLLLISTVAIIAACYLVAFYSIKNDSKFQTILTPSISGKYKGNQLPNGASPLDACFGRGINEGNATLTIKNGASSDAIVCLFSTSLKRTIRNTYIRKNSTYTMDSISQDNYRIRVFFGNDWNPELENPCGLKGYFESDVYFSEFDKTHYFEDNNHSYTVATVTLHKVSGGNARTSQINQEDFFKSNN